MAYHDVNQEGLTFSEWVQAAGHYVPSPMGDDYGCAPYSMSSSYVCEISRNGNEQGLPARFRQGRVVRSSWTFFPKRLRDAWRNGEDPTEHRAVAPGRRL